MRRIVTVNSSPRHRAFLLKTTRYSG
jgi:hypothetical protein